jgi:hypothetical protein
MQEIEYLEKIEAHNQQRLEQLQKNLDDLI